MNLLKRTLIVALLTTPIGYLYKHVNELTEGIATLQEKMIVLSQFENVTIQLAQKIDNIKVPEEKQPVNKNEYNYYYYPYPENDKHANPERVHLNDNKANNFNTDLRFEGDTFVPKKSGGFNESRSLYEDLDTNEYSLSIAPKRATPFRVTPEIIKKAREIVGLNTDTKEDVEPDFTAPPSPNNETWKKQNNEELRRAKALWEWMTKNILYGETENSTRDYQDAVEVFQTKKGVCGEMAALYVVMCRAVGLRSNWVSVEKNFRGEEVSHACAMVMIEGKPILVDISYYTFDIKHKLYEILDDNQVSFYYKELNN